MVTVRMFTDLKKSCALFQLGMLILQWPWLPALTLTVLSLTHKFMLLCCLMHNIMHVTDISFSRKFWIFVCCHSHNVCSGNEHLGLPYRTFGWVVSVGHQRWGHPVCKEHLEYQRRKKPRLQSWGGPIPWSRVLLPFYRKKIRLVYPA